MSDKKKSWKLFNVLLNGFLLTLSYVPALLILALAVCISLSSDFVYGFEKVLQLLGVPTKEATAVGSVLIVLAFSFLWSLASFKKKEAADEKVAKAEAAAFGYNKPEVKAHVSRGDVFYSHIHYNESASSHSSRSPEYSQDAQSKHVEVSPEVVDNSKISDLPRTDHLLSFYNAKIDVYQLETLGRAHFSFVAAVIAMIVGILFVIWGGSVIITGGDWLKAVAGSVISIVGSTISAYITKTFFDMHRISLAQLNRYFRQPVLNSNILMAQRLADLLSPEERSAAYKTIIEGVVRQIDAETNEDEKAIVDATLSTSISQAKKTMAKIKAKDKTPEHYNHSR
jgi:hypothetical protein